MHCQSESLLHLCVICTQPGAKRVLRMTKPLNVLEEVKDITHYRVQGGGGGCVEEWGPNVSHTSCIAHVHCFSL